MNVFLVEKNLEPLVSKVKENPSDWSAMEGLNCFHRINVVSALYRSQYGWLGASYSCVELLSSIYYRFITDPKIPVSGRNSLFLSKGHGVLTQYSILASLGMFPVKKMLEYKEVKGLPGHCDRETPGIDSSSGSLGQGLSKALGLAKVHQAAGKNHRCFVLLGDGELQEGQIFEALMSLRQWNLRNCVPIIDRNFMQSAKPVTEVKDFSDWPAIFRGMGFELFEIDGHNLREIAQTLDLIGSATKPCIIIAETKKGGGTKITEMSKTLSQGEESWHARIPNSDEYSEILRELVEKSGDKEVSSEFKKFSVEKVVPAPKNSDSMLFSTEDSFGGCLSELGKKHERFLVLSADLEKACRLSDFARTFPNRFLEVGISEQDLGSIACGIGLGGKIAIVNTFSAFLKRGYDQIFSVVQEKVPVIFVGHYSGLDYFTDGKAHQSLNDIGFMRMFPGLDIFEPLNDHETRIILDHLLERMEHEIKESLAMKRQNGGQIEV